MSEDRISTTPGNSSHCPACAGKFSSTPRKPCPMCGQSVSLIVLSPLPPVESITALRRISVLAGGLVLGAAFSLLVAGPMMPSGMATIDRAVIWACVMGGPVVGTWWDLHHLSLILPLAVQR